MRARCDLLNSAGRAHRLLAAQTRSGAEGRSPPALVGPVLPPRTFSSRSVHDNQHSTVFPAFFQSPVTVANPRSSPIPKAPKAQCASLGCDLIRSSNCHPDLTPGTTDAQIEPGPQKRVDHCCGADRSDSGRQSLGTFLHVLVIRRAPSGSAYLFWRCLSRTGPRPSTPTGSSSSDPSTHSIQMPKH